MTDVKVKSLEWELDRGIPAHEYARDPLTYYGYWVGGYYHIEKSAGWWSAGTFGNKGQAIHVGYFETLAAAKSAAQADYERRILAAIELVPAPQAMPLDYWYEDNGFVTWWAWDGEGWRGEPAYIGSPLCDDWPGYHTHWTPHPEFPPALARTETAQLQPHKLESAVNE